MVLVNKCLDVSFATQTETDPQFTRLRPRQFSRGVFGETPASSVPADPLENAVSADRCRR